MTRRRRSPAVADTSQDPWFGAPAARAVQGRRPRHDRVSPASPAAQDRALRGGPPFVTRELFRFLQELRRHNDRAWFIANKERYLAHVRDPLLAFVAAVAPALRAVSPQIVADPRPSGGSLLRIYRDTRFARDKKPYKTNAGLYFGHAAGKDIHAPGYYLHLEPGQVFMAAGMWRPDPDALRAIREAIVDDPHGWKRARRSRLHGGDPLTRAPRGFDPAHPLIEDLKRTSFTAATPFTEKQACAPDFRRRFARACLREVPLMRFLAKAVGLPF
jgi:uncharacterized protein (TIGR02453 family)